MSLRSLFASVNRGRLFGGLAALAISVIVAAGVFARNGWLPATDPMSGKRTGWFGKELPKNASSSWNPFAAPLPTPTPQLSKEYIYAGSRLLAVEDAGANAAAPADLAVWRPGSGVWYVLGGPNGGAVGSWGGVQNDDPVEGDYDGDGKTDLAIYRPGSTAAWWIMRSSDSTYYSEPFGTTGDRPVQADYDGDGRTDIAVFRSSSGQWHIYASTNGYYALTYGDVSGDEPAPADFDGDGRADPAFWRPSTTAFYSLNSQNSQTQTHSLGQSGTPVSGDYDGDGKADPAVFNSATGYWYVRKSTTNSVWTSPQWGAGGDIPVPNDYDADGKCDIAIWRPANGTWYILNSSNGSNRIVQWGASGDIPVPAFYRR